MVSIAPVASPVGPREEAFLETFFSVLGQLAFDKAKDMMVRFFQSRERESYFQSCRCIRER